MTRLTPLWTVALAAFLVAANTGIRMHGVAQEAPGSQLALATSVDKEIDCTPGSKTEVEVGFNVTTVRFFNNDCLCYPKPLTDSPDDMKQFARDYISAIMADNDAVRRVHEDAARQGVPLAIESSEEKTELTVYCYDLRELRAIAESLRE